MKDLWKYVSLFLAVLFVGFCLINFNTQSKLQNKIIELQEQAPVVVEKYVHDTITFDSVQIKWKTKTSFDTITTKDTIVQNDTVFISTTNEIQEESAPFSFSTFHQDSVIVANIYVEGKGVPTKTYIDSVSLDYTVKQTEIKKKCCWIKRLFGCCE